MSKIQVTSTSTSVSHADQLVTCWLLRNHVFSKLEASDACNLVSAAPPAFKAPFSAVLKSLNRTRRSAMSLVAAYLPKTDRGHLMEADPRIPMNFESFYGNMFALSKKYGLEIENQSRRVSAAPAGPGKFLQQQRLSLMRRSWCVLSHFLGRGISYREFSRRVPDPRWILGHYKEMLQIAKNGDMKNVDPNEEDSYPSSDDEDCGCYPSDD